MKIKVSFYDGPPLHAAATAEAAKKKAEASAAKANTKGASRAAGLAAEQDAHAADEAAKKAALPLAEGLREDVLAVCTRFGVSVDTSNNFRFMITCSSPAQAKEIMQDPELNALAPIQIETMAA
jgi:hypothetical protein